jgi:hypothetical protein
MDNAESGQSKQPSYPEKCPSDRTDQEFYDSISDTPLLRDTTKGPYLSGLNTIKRYTGNDIPLNDIFLNADKYYHVIREGALANARFSKERSPNGPLVSLKSILRTVLAVLKYSCVKMSKPDAYNRWNHYFTTLTKELEELEDNNVATTQYMAWDDVLARQKWLTINSYASVEHVTLSMYTLIPPRRQHDYWKLATDPLHDSDDCTGVLNLNIKPATMQIRAFKNVERHNVYNAELPDELVQIIRAYLTTKKRAGRGMLFTRINGMSYITLNSFTDTNNKVVKRALDNPNASINTLRHSCATHVNTNPHMLREQKRAIATAMSHSLECQQLYVVVATPPPRL